MKKDYRTDIYKVRESNTPTSIKKSKIQNYILTHTQRPQTGSSLHIKG